MSSPTYTIVAGDGQTYGANPHETIQAWINEGRVARETQMARSDVEGWFRAGDYQEFAWPAGAAAPTPVVVETSPASFRPAGGSPRGGSRAETRRSALAVPAPHAPAGPASCGSPARTATAMIRKIR